MRQNIYDIDLEQLQKNKQFKNRISSELKDIEKTTSFLSDFLAS